MKRLLLSLLRLYPASWRARYAEEFTAHLESIEPRWTDAADMIFQALRLHAANPQLWRTAAIAMPTSLAATLLAAHLSVPTQSVVSIQLEAPNPESITQAIQKVVVPNSPADLRQFRVEATTTPSGNPVFNLSYRHPDSKVANYTVNVLAASLAAADQRLTFAPTTTHSTYGPNWLAFTGLGLFLGALLTAAKLRLRPTLN